jgi:hypothetical protein
MLPTISEHVGAVPRVVRLKDCGVRGKVGGGVYHNAGSSRGGGRCKAERTQRDALLFVAQVVVKFCLLEICRLFLYLFTLHTTCLVNMPEVTTQIAHKPISKPDMGVNDYQGFA